MRGFRGGDGGITFGRGGARSRFFLKAGEVHVAADPCAITTVLGSCIAVCLFDPAASIGGMNHFLLPAPIERSPRAVGAAARFGTHAMDELAEAVRRAGARPEALVARVFGGACTLDAFRARSIGAENADVALAFLASRGIPVAQLDVGGSHGRRVMFHTDDGTASVKLL